MISSLSSRMGSGMANNNHEDVPTNGVEQSPVGSLRITLLTASILLPPMASPLCIVEYDNQEHISNIASETSIGSWVWNEELAFDVQTSQPVHGIRLLVFSRDFGMNSPTPPDDTLVATCCFEVNDDQVGTQELPIMLSGTTGDAWIRLRTEIKMSSRALDPSCFTILRLLGRGSFGKVLLVRKNDTQRVYAMKVLNKRELIRRNEVEHTMSERNVLVRGGPFIVSLKFSFQTPTHLYLLLPFLSGGELFFHLQHSSPGRFSEARARFYAAELVLALEYLHKNGVLYRDLKPENCLLDAQGHVMLTDFGLAKDFQTTDAASGKTGTFCGTSEYLAPEVIKGEPYGKEIDYWALGILLYEMLTSLPPFYAENVHLMYRKIIAAPLTFPSHVSHIARLLISRLLDRNPSTRLGSGPRGAEEVKRHMFFAGIDWDKLARREIAPPFKPKLESSDDVRYFDCVFTHEESGLSISIHDPLDGVMDNAFEGFSWSEPASLGQIAEPHSHASEIGASSFFYRRNTNKRDLGSGSLRIPLPKDDITFAAHAGYHRSLTLKQKGTVTPNSETGDDYFESRHDELECDFTDLAVPGVQELVLNDVETSSSSSNSQNDYSMMNHCICPFLSLSTKARARSTPNVNIER